MYIEGNNYFRIKELEDLGIGAIYTLKSYEDVRKLPKEKFIEDFQLGDRKIVAGYQTHTKNIEIITENSNTFYFENTDGFITDRRDIVIYTKYADCLPIYIYDFKNKVISLVHSGWKGTYEEIALESIKLMEQNFNSKRESILVAFGIGISQRNYEVQENFLQQFSEKFPKDLIEGSFLRKDDKIYFDNQKFNFLNLKRNGILEKNIIVNNYCTYEDKRFHSFRREKENSGRAGGFIYFK